ELLAETVHPLSPGRVSTTVMPSCGSASVPKGALVSRRFPSGVSCRAPRSNGCSGVYGVEIASVPSGTVTWTGCGSGPELPGLGLGSATQWFAEPLMSSCVDADANETDGALAAMQSRRTTYVPCNVLGSTTTVVASPIDMPALTVNAALEEKPESPA